MTNCTRMAAPRSGPTYKVVLRGEVGVGITSLLRRLKDNTFDECDYEYQRGIDSCTKVVEVDGETVMLSIRDGPEYERRLEYLETVYAPHHDAFVFVYSVSDACSLHYLAQWIKDAQIFSPRAVRMLIGNKEDLEPEIDPTTTGSFAKAHELDLKFTISCKTNSGIEEAFEQLARVLYQSSPKTDGRY